jgi:dienelactone hydrolase
MRGRWVPTRRLVPAVALVAVLAACVPATSPPPAPTAFASIAAPEGATPGAADAWYWAPAPNGRAVTLGVFNPTASGPLTTTSTTQPPVTTTLPPVTTTTAAEPTTTTTSTPEATTTTTAGTAPEPVTTTTTTPGPPPESVGTEPSPSVRPPAGPKGREPTLLILNGGDGFRSLYETLAERFAAQGFLVIVGCWYEHPTPLAQRANGIACVNGPSWKGMNSSSVADLNALVDAAKLVPGVDPTQFAILGHSYGAGVALLRAATGHDEPVISSSGFVARFPTYDGGLPYDQYAAEVARSIHAPVLVVHGRADPITPIGQAQALVAALPSANPATTDYFMAPASHGLPWQIEQLNDRPGEPMWQRYIEDISFWVHARLS